MGHVRLGTLPKTRAWKEVVNLIADGGDIDEIAVATMKAADKAFESIQNDPGYLKVAGFMANLAVAAKTGDAVEYLQSLGLNLSANTNLAELTMKL